MSAEFVDISGDPSRVAANRKLAPRVLAVPDEVSPNRSVY